MQVLKFGGTSVGTSEAILKMIAIVKARVNATPTIVVVSAMSGVTDQLILLAQTASQGNEAYKTIIQNLAEKHEEAVRALLPTSQQSETLSIVKELIQGDCTSEKIRFELNRILPGGESRSKMEKDFTELSQILGGGGASKKVAQYLLKTIPEA